MRVEARKAAGIFRIGGPKACPGPAPEPSPGPKGARQAFGKGNFRASFALGAEWFDVLDGDERIELGRKEKFFGYLEENADDFAPGDAVLIKGKTPWDPYHVHFHSFFVYESDPVTGMPLVVVGNAGRPSLR